MCRDKGLWLSPVNFVAEHYVLLHILEREVVALMILVSGHIAETV